MRPGAIPLRNAGMRACGKPPSTARSGGFTLLEMLVSVGLLAVLGLATALALSSSQRSQAQIEGRMTSLGALQRAQQLIRRDLEQVLLRQGRDELGDPLQQLFIAQAQADPAEEGLLLAFFQGGRRPFGSTFSGSTVERVRYRLSGGSLIRESSPVLDPSGDTAWRSRTLLEQVDNLALQLFYDRSWQDNWPPPNQDQGPVLPKAVRLSLSLPPFGELEQLILLPGGA